MIIFFDLRGAHRRAASRHDISAACARGVRCPTLLVMQTPLLTRRHFIGTLPAIIPAAALLHSQLRAAAPALPRVGCQANGFTLKPGDFPALLAALRKMKALGYTGFECNVR